MLWDLFCRVVDNHGDLGVCWRLAADLAARGQQVRLWVDDASALQWMAPPHERPVAVTVLAWTQQPPDLAPGDVVIEAFGCNPPPAFVARMVERPPVWINLEYLSAEDYVERSHGLPSPVGALTKWFFYPGFTGATGGLLREAQALDPGPPPWGPLGVQPQPGERCISVFAYADAPFAALFERLAGTPTLLLLAAGASQAPALAAWRARPPAGVRVHSLPWLSQRDYDRLLHACALNVARGEDSIVRALWAGAPCLWDIYKQADGVHARKLDALLDRMGAATPVRSLWRAWNRLGPWPDALPPGPPWQQASRAWRDRLCQQSDLTSQLLRFVAAKR